MGQNVFSDNLSEFSNKEYITICESLTITVQKIIAKSPFFKGLSGHLNAALEDILLKVSHNKNITTSIHLQWIRNTENLGNIPPKSTGATAKTLGKTLIAGWIVLMKVVMRSAVN